MDENEIAFNHQFDLPGLRTTPKCLREVGVAILQIAEMMDEKTYTTHGGLLISVSGDNDNDGGFTIQSDLSITFQN